MGEGPGYHPGGELGEGMGTSGSGGATAPLFDDGLPALEALVRGDALLAFDYDGTLAPIVANPRRAQMRESTRSLFATVTRRFRCAVISGRAREDVLGFLEGSAPVLVLGDHGAGTARATGTLDLIGEWRAELDELLETLPGIVIEDKPFSLAVHYRACPDRHEARARVRRASAGLEAVRVVGGIHAVNLLPLGLPHKGTAVLCACEQFQRRQALFVGDDDTDEDAFAADPARVLGVRIGASARSSARYHLRDQSEIDVLLERLIALRTRWSN